MPSSQTICSASAITTIGLSGEVSGTVYNWTRGNTANVTGIAASGSGGISGSLTNTTNAPITVTFTITPTANGCSGTPITATVTVDPVSVGGSIAGSATVCSGTNSTTLTLSDQVGSIQKWQSSLSSDFSSPTDIPNTTTSLTATNLSQTTYYRAVVQGGVCAEALSSVATVTVNPLPTATVSGGGTVCQGQPLPSVSISLTGTAPFTLTYSDGTTPTTVTTSANPHVIANAPAGSYTVTALSDANCTGTSLTGSAIVSVNALPTVNAGYDRLVILGFGSNCTSLTAAPAGGSGSGYTFSWEPGNLSGQTVQVCPLQTTSYTVTLTDGNGCRATDQVTVNVQDVRCGNKNQNVQICYYGVSQCVSEKIAKNYLKLGATLGACGSNVPVRIGYEAEAAGLSLTVRAYPNPTTGRVTVEVQSPVAGIAQFEVLNAGGQAVQQKAQQLSEGLNEVPFELGAQPAGNYLIRCVDGLGRQAVVRVSKQ